MNQSIQYRSLTNSLSVEYACDSFLDEVKSWAYACIGRYRNESPTDNHDQLTYVTGWEPYVRASRDPDVIHFLTSTRDAVAAHFTTNDHWRHGYWRMQEAHHGTEHFELFLGFLSRVLADTSETRNQLIDAVEHVGNWSAAVPEWFDYSTGLFRSLYFGTDGVRDDAHELNMPDHLRCASLLMLAYEMTRESTYLELANAYSQKWASAICDEDTPLPIGMTRDGVLYDLTGSGEETYRAFAGMAGDLDTDLDRAENILASSGIQLFLKLWQETNEDLYLQAVQRLLRVLSSELEDPDAGPVADAIRIYRRVTGRNDFDRCITQVVAGLSPLDVRRVGIALPPTLSQRPAGVGKRSDMPVWYEGDGPRRHNPILISVAAEILDDHALAICAVDMAKAYFTLAVQALPDGRHHGCAARTVSAIARGHGRDNHAGMTTSVLLPTMTSFGML